MLRTIMMTTILLATDVAANSQEVLRGTLYKNPQCGCCESYADYLRANGFDIEVEPTNELSRISLDAGVPENAQGCHTMFVDGYVVDGHVSADIVRKLLSKRPEIAGITLPGMPLGSPGMGGEQAGAFAIFAVTKDGKTATAYATD
jgi:hypothetical protein